ncbi:MAG: lamin tail domain-containing protein [Anaerolineae bacterium]|nr:lamin tail domain-containing protein [Anaerolineae bacterium]
MQRRSLILFVLFNILISLGVALGVIWYMNSRSPAAAPAQLITVEIRITNTPDLSATVPVRIITATPQPGALQNTPAEVADLPTDLLSGGGNNLGTPLPTIDAQALGASAALAETATALPEFCIPHVLKEGDTPFGVAEIYQADPFRLLEVNGLDEATSAFLQVGDVLIVPLDGCPLGLPVTATPPPTETPTDEALTPTPSFTPPPTAAAATNTPTVTIQPTITLAPTAANAVIRIVEVLNVGDVTAEAVTIRNTGQITNIANWTLSDDDGNTYTFAEQRLFTNAQITLYTRIGTNSPVALYWGRDQAVFEPGDVITLRDAAGAVQATYRVPG